MKATYQDFIFSNPNCSNYELNTDAKKVFNFLNQDENIIKMIDFIEQGKPALAGCVIEVEDFFDNLNNPTIDFNDGFTRTVVGRMVKSILEPFGYVVTKQKDFTKNKKGKYFTSASCYQYIGNATMQVVKKVQPIKKDI